MAIFDPAYLRRVKRVEEEPEPVIQDGVVGVCWDYSNTSPKLTRLTPENDPYGYVTLEIKKEPVPAVGTEKGSSPFDWIRPWCEMREKNIDLDDRGREIEHWDDDSQFSRSVYDTYVWIPIFYYVVKDDSTNSKRYWYVSSTSRPGLSRHSGSGKFIGRYVVGTDFNSRSGVSPAYSKSFETFQTEAESKVGRAMMSYSTYCAAALLALVEFATWDLGRTIGPGYTQGSAKIVSGHTDSMTYHTGSVTKTTAGQMQYRWIEGLYGNIWQLVDGALAYNGNVYLARLPVYNGPSYANKTNVGAHPITSGSATVVSRIKYLPNFQWAFVPDDYGAVNSYTTWTTDSYWYRSGLSTYAYAVGDIYHGQGSGIVSTAFYFGLTGDSSLGTRWMHDA